MFEQALRDLIAKWRMQDAKDEQQDRMLGKSFKPYTTLLECAADLEAALPSPGSPLTGAIVCCTHCGGTGQAAQPLQQEVQAKTPGEDAWLFELELAASHGNVIARDKFRSILRAYRANLLSQTTSLQREVEELREGQVYEAIQQSALEVGNQYIKLRPDCDIWTFCSEVAASIRKLLQRGEGAK